MSLADIWRMSPEQLKDKHILQIISFAGSGKLRHNSTLKELRSYFACVPSPLLSRYLYETIGEPFDGDAIVLSELVNEVGRRLGFQVKKRTSTQVNYTGLWKMKGNTSIITAIQRNNLPLINPVALLTFKKELEQKKVIDYRQSSILIIAAPGDTTNLEQQLRGSNIATEFRLIGIEALLKLMRLKEDLEDPLVLQQLLELLTPHDFLRVDGLIDLLLSVITDIPTEITPEVFMFDDGVDEEEKGETAKKKESKPKIPDELRDACVERIEKHLQQTFVKESRVIYTSPDRTKKIVCLTASLSVGSGRFPYFWFGFRPKQKEAIEKAEEGYLALVCSSEELIILIPYNVFSNWLEGMNISGLAEEINHWNIVIYKETDKMRLKTGRLDVDLTQYVLPSKIGANGA